MRWVVVQENEYVVIDHDKGLPDACVCPAPEGAKVGAKNLLIEEDPANPMFKWKASLVESKPDLDKSKQPEAEGFFSRFKQGMTGVSG